jgi:hypothetical protein
MKSFFSSLRVRLLILVIVAIVPCSGIIINTEMVHRSAAADHARTKALSLIRQVGNEQKNIIESTRNLLIALSEMPDVRQAHSRATSAFLADMIKRLTLYTNIGLVRPDGQVIASAVPFMQPVNYADTEWFQQTIKSGKFTESDYLGSAI